MEGRAVRKIWHLKAFGEDTSAHKHENLVTLYVINTWYKRMTFIIYHNFNAHHIQHINTRINSSCKQTLGLYVKATTTILLYTVTHSIISGSSDINLTRNLQNHKNWHDNEV